MVKEDVNSANGCDEVSMSDANVDDSNGAKSERTLSTEMTFEKSWKGLGVRGYADKQRQ